MNEKVAALINEGLEKDAFWGSALGTASKFIVRGLASAGKGYAGKKAILSAYKTNGLRGAWKAAPITERAYDAGKGLAKTVKNNPMGTLYGVSMAKDLYTNYKTPPPALETKQQMLEARKNGDPEYKNRIFDYADFGDQKQQMLNQHVSNTFSR